MARLTFDGGTLVLQGVPPNFLQQFDEPQPWTWDPRSETFRCDARHYASVRQQLLMAHVGQPFQADSQAGKPDLRMPLQDHVCQWSRVTWPRVALPPLRPEQAAAVAAWRRRRRGVIVMPTGTGKTEVALAIMVEAAVATLVVAPVRDLMYQWHRRILTGLGYEAGLIGDNRFRVEPVSVTTYDSACLHMERLGNRFGLIIFDECHHLPGPFRSDAARMCASPQRLGLTATPQRDGCTCSMGFSPRIPSAKANATELTSRGAKFDTDQQAEALTQLIGPVAYELPLSAVRGRTLADYQVIRIPVHLSDAEQYRYDQLSQYVRKAIFHRRREDPHATWHDICRAAATDRQAHRALQAFRAKQVIEDRADEKLRVLEDLFRLHVGEPCLVFAGSNAMAREVSRRFLIPCLLSHCGRRERREILQGLEEGVYPALVANRVLDEGVDLPAVKVAIVIGGTASTRQAQQRLGRILRKSGDRQATLYEVVCGDTNEAQRSRRRRRSAAYCRHSDRQGDTEVVVPRRVSLTRRLFVGGTGLRKNDVERRIQPKGSGVFSVSAGTRVEPRNRSSPTQKRLPTPSGPRTIRQPMESAMDRFEEFTRRGFVLLRQVYSPRQVQAAIESFAAALAHENAKSSVLAQTGGPAYGARNLLRFWPEVVELVRGSPLLPTLLEILGPGGGLVRGLYFDKPPGHSWSLPWHRDLTIAVQRHGRLGQFQKPTTKAGVPHLEAPRELLECMVTARIHLDPVTDSNGPLVVLPGSHRLEYDSAAGNPDPVSITCGGGDVLLMRPRLMHSSRHSAVNNCDHRRTIHLEFAPEINLPDDYQWHDFVPLR